MINNINSNSYSNLSKAVLTNRNNQAKRIQDKSAIKIDLEAVSKEQFAKLNKSQKEEVANLLKRIQGEIAKAEIIAVKIVKGETLNFEEKKFIKEKYPDLKQVAEESAKEVKELKHEIKNLKSEEQKQQVISKAINNIKLMNKKGILSEVQTKIKMSGIEEVEKFIKNIQTELKKAEMIAVKIVKGEILNSDEKNFIKEKYPDLKQLAKESEKEVKELKHEIKNLKSEEQKQQAISKAINNIKLMNKKGILSEAQTRIKMSGIEEVEKFIKNIQKELKKSEIIAIKMIKSEKLTPKEKNLINEKYPELRHEVEKYINKSNSLKEQLKLCKNEEERQQIVSKEIKNIENMSSKGIISESELKINMAAIEEAVIFIKDSKLEINKEERENDEGKLLKFIINPYFYVGTVSDNLSSIFIIIAIITIIYLFL
ncbi:hypothetical protein [Romboutsia sp. 1001216sp1]|uniref:hypothetical protein n=1 Tax=Romboutsia sp. 1001216sp1 TaxID=2986997 RepID=UPI0023308B8C|nr:hypothetical protein [Romboutsia sp. 1001216sp1]MDB8805226.1 hypothetical protein [Romboutsia sp. 1001216sp1]MDB8807100.1 hypothetical protein [Romboutsia sp. 1001216sp1]MDB8810871.1 hypothetical protein [Romboutsia sp. 1001216sp1]MDB8816591.1 hypothetical protein [Romboutsia sp. 1001216sp1]MDB8819124.1 hypothetical protein [Romboutsia sp. 1001216sp1]